MFKPSHGVSLKILVLGSNVQLEWSSSVGFNSISVLQPLLDLALYIQPTQVIPKTVFEILWESSEIVGPAFPSSGSTPPTPGWSADVEVIRRVVSELVEKEQEVVAVMHSFSGVTGGTALDGLDKESRVAKNLKGGVIRLIYVVAFLVPEGFQHSPHGTRDNMVPEMKTDLDVSDLVYARQRLLADH